MALADFGKEAVEPLVKAFREQGPEVRKCAALALGNIGEPAFEFMKQMVNDKDAGVRADAISVLGMIRSKDAFDVFTTALKDEDSEVRMSATWALGKLEDKAAVEHVAALLEDRDEKVRICAAITLAELGDNRAIELLIEAVKSTEKTGMRSISIEATWALRTLTKQEFDNDYNKWKEWYEKNKDK